MALLWNYKFLKKVEMSVCRNWLRKSMIQVQIKYGTSTV